MNGISKAREAVERWHLGMTSEKYETGGRGVGTVSTGRGDHGGVSYGAYQLSTRSGTLGEYLSQSVYGTRFAALRPATQAFNEQWKRIAEADPGFAEDQHDFIRRSHYEVQLRRLRDSGVDLSQRGRAVQDALWSTSVQFRGLTKKLVIEGLQDAFGVGIDISAVSDVDLISAIQDYKTSHNKELFRSSPDLWAGLLRRAHEEKADLIELAACEAVLSGMGLQGDRLHPVAFNRRTAGRFGNDLIAEVQSGLNDLYDGSGDHRDLVVDGDFGPATKRVIESFQRRHGMPVTGIADAMTFAAVQESLRVHRAVDGAEKIGEQYGLQRNSSEPGWRGVPYDLARPPSPAPAQAQDALVDNKAPDKPRPKSTALLHPDLLPDAVRALQEDLNALGMHGAKGRALVVDGVYGRNTALAVAAFQREEGLPVTGVADNRTQGAVRSHAIVAPFENSVAGGQPKHMEQASAAVGEVPIAYPARKITPRDTAVMHEQQRGGLLRDEAGGLRATYASFSGIAGPGIAASAELKAPRRAADLPDHIGVGRTDVESPAAVHSVPASERAPHSALCPFSDPSHPQHALYNDLKERLPDVPEDRLIQLTGECHKRRYQPGWDGSIEVCDQAIFISQYWPPGRHLSVDLQQSAPSVQQTMQEMAELDGQRLQAQGPTRQQHTIAG